MAANDYRTLHRLRRIAEALDIGIGDLVGGPSTAPLHEWKELFESFMQIKDPKLRKAVNDLAREYSQKS